jgi:hypothetical protein
LRWGSIVGGTVAALGIAVLLYSLGLALGLSAIDPQDPGSLRPSSIFTGIWALVVSLVALFVGGYVAARGASALTRMAGGLHGLVMWGLTVVAGMWLLGNVVSGLVSGASVMTRSAADAVRGGSMALPQLTQQFGLGLDDALMPINARLQAEGKPTVTPQQLEASTRDVVQSGLRQGRLDRQTLISALTANTALGPNDAADLAARIETRFTQSRAEMRQDALSVAEDTGKAFWGVFGALLLGMLAAVGGALVGSAKVDRTRAQPVVRGRAQAHVARREVYP